MHAGLPLLLQVVVAPDWPSYTATWRLGVCQTPNRQPACSTYCMCWIVAALLAFFHTKCEYLVQITRLSLKIQKEKRAFNNGCCHMLTCAFELRTVCIHRNPSLAFGLSSCFTLTEH